MNGPAPRDMPAAYLPLCPGDLVKLDGRDAVITDDPAVPGSVVVAVMVEPSELTWVGRYRQ